MEILLIVTGRIVQEIPSVILLEILSEYLLKVSSGNTSWNSTQFFVIKSSSKDAARIFHNNQFPWNLSENSFENFWGKSITPTFLFLYFLSEFILGNPPENPPGIPPRVSPRNPHGIFLWDLLGIFRVIGGKSVKVREITFYKYSLSNQCTLSGPAHKLWGENYFYHEDDVLEQWFPNFLEVSPPWTWRNIFSPPRWDV